MKRIVILIACAVLFFINSKAQTIYFDSLYNYNQEAQFGFDVFQLGDSGYITLTGSFNINNNVSDLISYYDSLGNRKLNKDYGDSGYEYYLGEWGSMQRTYDGGYAFGGNIIKISDYSSPAMLMKLNAKGDTEFVKTYGDTTHDWQLFYRCIQTHDSGYALIGAQSKNWRDSLTYGNYMYVVRTDKHGNLLWQQSYDENKVDVVGWSIVELPNHHLVLSGATEISGVYNPLITETDSAGNVLKQRMLNGVNFAIGGRMTPAYGKELVEWNYIDTTINAGDYHIGSVITILDSNYNIINRIIYNHTVQNYIEQVRQLKDSSFVLVGLLENTDSAYSEGWVAKMDKNGEKEWQHYYFRSYLYNDFADFEQTEDKGFIITGRAFDPSIPDYTQDLWLVKLDSNGCLQPGCALNIETAEVEVKPQNHDIEIYPNPTSNILYLANLPKQTATLQYTIINTLGQTKQSNTLPPNNTLANINVSALPAGIYFIRLMDNKGFVYSVKFVKE